MKAFILSCIKFFSTYFFLICPRVFKKPDRSVLKGFHYAHRGLFDNETEAPENSLAAFQKAVDRGYGIELDVQLSKDDIPIVFHDHTLDRMCGVEGRVCDYTVAQLKELHLGNSDEKIPTVKEAMNVIGGQTPVIIEYKPIKGQTKVCKLTEFLLREYEGTYCIESFHPLAVLWYKFNRPNVIRGQLCMKFGKDEEFGKMRYYPLRTLSLLLTNVLTRPDFISYKWSDYKSLPLKICEKFGAMLVAWTIQSEEAFNEARDHFDLFIFDSIEL